LRIVEDGMGRPVKLARRKSSMRRRLAIALVTVGPAVLTGGCSGHGIHAHHHSHGYGGHYGRSVHGGTDDILLLPVLLFYVLFWAAGSC